MPAKIKLLQYQINTIIINMKLLTLTHNVTDKAVIINWANVLYVAETESNFNEKYTEVAFVSTEGSLGVKQSPEEILSLLNEAE